MELYLYDKNRLIVNIVAPWALQKRPNKFMLFKHTVKSRSADAIIKIAAFAPN